MPGKRSDPVETTRILLAEDDIDHQCLLTAALTDGRPHVDLRLVSTGEDLLRTISRESFDCVVVDYNLPDCEAGTLLPRLARDGEQPTIVISSSREQRIVIDSMRGGSMDFVPKEEAVRSDALWRRVEHAVRAQRRRNSARRQQARRQRDLATLAITDPLTGLCNRRCLDDAVRGRRRAFERRGVATAAMIDLDRFKSINDAHGHAVGDAVLIATANVLKEQTQPADTLCRWGGEEFMCILPGKDLCAAWSWAHAVRTRIASLSIPAGEQTIRVTASFGLATLPGPEVDEKAMRLADEALYLAKRRGRNRVCTYDMVAFEAAASELSRRDDLDFEGRLRAVLDSHAGRLGPTQIEHLTVHSEDVARLGARLARALQLDASDVERIRVAGLAHDIGKLIVPEAVLAKPVALSAEERRFMVLHAELGAEIVLQLGADPAIVAAVRYHHHAFGGDGAPAEPRGRALPLAARILAVADAVVTMTSQRPYRSARSYASAAFELRRCRGTQFDPDVVDALPRAILLDTPASLIES